MSTIKFSEKISLNCGVAQAFDYTQDYGQRLALDTFLKRAELVGGAETAALGVKAWCVARNGWGMEQIIGIA